MKAHKMKLSTGSRFLMSLAFSSLAISAGATNAQTKSGNQKDYERLIYSVKGPDLYRAHCAACHGSDGKGGGPTASSLRVKPADLTLLSKNNTGKFPTDRIQKIISGDAPTLLSHGSREMPVWGPIFH